MLRKRVWLVAFFLSACSGETQDAARVFLDLPVESRVPGGVVVPGSERRDSVVLALQGRSVPLLVEWNVARDREGCLVPGRLKIHRNGGDEQLVVDSVWVGEVECATPFYDESDTIRAAETLISGLYRVGKSDVQGSIAKVSGRGQLTVIERMP